MVTSAGIRRRRVGLGADDARNREVALPAAAAAQLARGPARLIVDDEVADRLPHLVQVGAREVVPLLRQVVVGRDDLGGEDGAGHGLCVRLARSSRQLVERSPGMVESANCD